MIINTVIISPEGFVNCLEDSQIITYYKLLLYSSKLCTRSALKIETLMQAQAHVQACIVRQQLKAMHGTRALMSPPLNPPAPPSSPPPSPLPITTQTGKQLVFVQAPVRNVSFWAACCIPGVATYAFTLFFCKLVAYTFLYWLPYYINSVTIASTKLSPQVATVVIQCLGWKAHSYLQVSIYIYTCLVAPVFFLFSSVTLLPITPSSARLVVP